MMLLNSTYDKLVYYYSKCLMFGFTFNFFMYQFFLLICFTLCNPSALRLSNQIGAIFLFAWIKTVKN